IHLGLGSAEQQMERETAFIAFLRSIENDCESLYIIGDLFDFWFEYSTVIPKQFYRTLAELKQWTSRGKSVTYLMGNHDFGHVSFFKEEFGITVFDDDITCDISGKRFYLAHGDGKAYNDFGYLILKKILRSPISKTLFRWIHPDIGIGIASWASRGSRMHTDAKEFGEQSIGDGLRDFAEKKIQNEQFDFVIMGHKHKAEVTSFGKGLYVNLGHWLSFPATYAIFDGQTLELKKTT
ncbi:MAG: UDP-2,3-diacylglucosamine diphosphatase, partial [Ignavibacteria bacterium]